MTIFDGDSPIAGASNVLSLFLVQLCLITVLSRSIGKFIKFFNQPLVIAEMIAGILLGPTAFGQIPSFSKYIFPPESLPVLRVFANFGLILFMFLVGLELEPDMLKKSLKKFSIISTVGVVVPFVCSIPVAVYLFNVKDNDGKKIWTYEDAKLGNFILFVGIAMGVSALPVLARILAERHMLQQKLGVVTMAATAIDDLEGWVLLAIVISIARASAPLNILWTFLCAVGQVLVCLFIIRPIFNRIAKKVEQTQRFTQDMFFIILVILVIFSFATEAIGLSGIFGAFEVGCMIPRNQKLMNQVVQKMEDVVISVFLPLYFTFSGIRTNFSLLTQAKDWGIVFMVLAVAFFSKIIGCAIPGRIIGNLNNKEALCFGILMQTKGLVALVVFNLGLEYQVITPKLFAINVIMVLISTILTTPIVEKIYPVKQMMKETLSQKTSKGAIFSCLIPVQNKTDSVAVTLVEPIVKGRGDPYSSAIEVISFTNSDQSSYLSTFYSQKKNYFDKALRTARKVAKRIAMKIECRTFLTHNSDEKICEDIVMVGKAINADLVILTSSYSDTYSKPQAPVFSQSATNSPKSEKSDKSEKSLSLESGEESASSTSSSGDGIELNENPYNGELESSLIKEIRNRTSANVALILKKSDVYVPIRFSKILVPIFHTTRQNKDEEELLQLAVMYSKAEGSEVTLLHILNSQTLRETIEEDVSRLTNLCIEDSSLKYKSTRSNDSLKAVTTELEAGKYQLILFSHTSYKKIINSATFYQNTNCTVVVLFDSLHTPTPEELAEKNIENIELVEKKDARMRATTDLP